MSTSGGKQLANLARLVAPALGALLLSAPSADAGSRVAQEKIAWMFTMSVKCPGQRVNFNALTAFVAREHIDFTQDSPEMLKIRAIGQQQQAKLGGTSGAKICAMSRAKFGPAGSDIPGLFR